MAFKPFEGSTVSKEFLPWCNDYVTKHPKHAGQQWDVTDIKQSEKGIIIECKDWAAWYWKSHRMHDFLLEFCKAWYASKQPSPVMVLVLQSKDPYFAIGTDDERLARWGQTTLTHWHQGYNHAKDNPEHSQNPLPMPPTSHGVHMQSETPSNTPPAMPEVMHDLSHVNEPGTASNNGSGVKPRSKG